MSDAAGAALINPDGYGDVRYRLNAVVIATQGSRAETLSLSSNVPDLMPLEYSKARLLFAGGAPDASAYDPRRRVTLPGGVVVAEIPPGMLRLGEEYGEVLPPWYPPASHALRGCLQLAPNAASSDSSQRMYSLHQGAFNHSIVCRRPHLVNTCQPEHFAPVRG